MAKKHETEMCENLDDDISQSDQKLRQAMGFMSVSESDDDDADKDATLQTTLPPTKSKSSKPSLPPKQGEDEEEEEEEEDIDDILSEFLPVQGLQAYRSRWLNFGLMCHKTVCGALKYVLYGIKAC